LLVEGETVKELASVFEGDWQQANSE